MDPQTLNRNYKGVASGGDRLSANGSGRSALSDSYFTGSVTSQHIGRSNMAAVSSTADHFFASGPTGKRGSRACVACEPEGFLL